MALTCFIGKRFLNLDILLDRFQSYPQTCKLMMTNFSLFSRVTVKFQAVPVRFTKKKLLNKLFESVLGVPLLGVLNLFKPFGSTSGVCIQHQYQQSQDKYWRLMNCQNELINKDVLWLKENNPSWLNQIRGLFRN